MTDRTRVLFNVHYDQVSVGGQRRDFSIRLTRNGSLGHGLVSQFELHYGGDRVKPILGVDDLQAMCMALAYLASVISLELKYGTKFYHSGTDEEVEFGAAFFAPIVWDQHW
jgi:hypothetical protein